MIWPFWKLCAVVVFCECVAIGVNVWTLYEHWNDAWWSFVPKAINVAFLCGAGVLAFWALRRAWKMDKEHKQYVSKVRKHDARRAR